MHAKRKGNIGQFATGLALSKLGYSIFTEEGDISKIDLIAEKDGKLIRIQSKAITPKNNKLEISMKKSGPNYKFTYDKESFDYFAAVDLTDGRVYLVDSSILLDHKCGFTLRKEKAKNNQNSKVNWADDFLLENILG